MPKRMLIDASHPEETRVVVYSGNRLEEFDYESASKKQLKGNIYLAKITRVEPSLQAAFVDYGGNRHGFLPFSEIHPDYYRIPIADREALIAEEASLRPGSVEEEIFGESADQPPSDRTEDAGEDSSAATAEEAAPQAVEETSESEAESAPDGEAAAAPTNGSGNGVEEFEAESSVDVIGGDEVEDAAQRRARLLRRYKIQEVIKRRQVILVQVTKEERGNKGAALTTYLSLAGRYCVLMPNTGKGGGISRKISNAKDRRRLKKIVEELDIPDGVAVIVRTAGSERTKAEIRRDYEYLLRLWNDIRETTLASTAPCLIYEEASLIKRGIRDLYQPNMDEILVEGEDGYKTAKDFMKSLMPSHARKVKLYKDAAVPLFYRYQVESQIDAMHNATVQLKSGGYVVINMTEALVAIDVNSGKATRERHIEETAYKTNLEAAEEITRQLRLRDLAGLIVIDFIDMDESRHNRSVERKLKDAMKHDRARIQLGRISHFGLLEMSRQRLRPSLFESSTVVCPHCKASGFVRTTDSVALHVLRGLEEEGIRRGGGEVRVQVPADIALHILNRMRDRLVEIEQRYGFKVWVESDESLIPPDYGLQRLSQAEGPAERAEAAETRVEAEPEEQRAEKRRARGKRRRGKRGEDAAEEPARRPAQRAQPPAEAEEEPKSAEMAEQPGETAEFEDDERPRRRRRRGKRGGRRRSKRQQEGGAEAAEPVATSEDQISEAAEPSEPAGTEAAEPTEPDASQAEDSKDEKKPRRRRSRGGRRKAAETAATNGAEVDSPANGAGTAPQGPEEFGHEGPEPAGGEPAPQHERTAQEEPQGEAARSRPEPASEETAAESAANDDTPHGSASPTEPAEDRPAPRRGWWQRLT